VTVDLWADAIASIESAGSGDYKAIGPRTKKGNRAYGRYQVMDFNIGPWTERYLGRRLSPDEFLADPAAQDAVFNGEFGSYVSKYGNPYDAASMWFTGRPAKEGAGAADINGMTGAGYVGKFRRALGALAGADPLVGAPGADPIARVDLGAGMDEAEEFGLLGGMLGPNARKYITPDRVARTQMALEGMTLNPNRGIMLSAQQRLKDGSDRDRRNKTAEWLEKRGRPDLAAGVRDGAIDGRAAVGVALAPPADDRTELSKKVAELMAMDMSLDEALAYLKSRGGPTINVGGSPSKYGEPPKDMVWRFDEKGEHVMDARGAPVADVIGGSPSWVKSEELGIERSELDAAAADVNKKALDRTALGIRAAGVVSGDIQRLKKVVGDANFLMPATGFGSGMMEGVRGTPAANASALIDTIAANLSFDRLQQMRDASPTGGALGAVSERELALLSSTLGSLSQTQTKSQFLEQLTRLEQIYGQIMRKFEAYPGMGLEGTPGVLIYDPVTGDFK